MMCSGGPCGAARSAEIACVIDAIPPEQRAAHFSLAQQLFGRLAHERCDLSNGYEFHFGPEAFEAVAAFVANERKCCPFVRFELVVVAGAGPVILRMTGPPGTREVLHAELLTEGQRH